MNCGVAFTGQAVHTGGKPHALHQGGDARRCPGRAGLPPPVRPEEEKRVGPALRVSTVDGFRVWLHVVVQ